MGDDFTFYDEDVGMDGIKTALDDNEDILSLEVGNNGQIESFTATYDGGQRAFRIEQTGDSYESLQAFPGDSSYAEQMNEGMEGLVGMINKGIGLYNRVARTANRLPRVDWSEKEQMTMEDMGLDVDFTDVDYTIIVGGAEPEDPSTDYGRMEPHRLYDQIEDEFKTGCQAGSCGSMYVVADGETRSLIEEDAFVPEDIRTFEGDGTAEPADDPLSETGDE